MSDKLLPCPFCGSKDVSEELNGDGWPIVMCDWCGAEGPQVELRRDEANALWNTRHSITNVLPDEQKTL